MFDTGSVLLGNGSIDGNAAIQKSRFSVGRWSTLHATQTLLATHDR
jgi:hypothetical protein